MNFSSFLARSVAEVSPKSLSSKPVRLYMCLHAYMNTCIHAKKHARTHAHRQADTQARTHAHARTHRPTRAHTHTAFTNVALVPIHQGPISEGGGDSGCRQPRLGEAGALSGLLALNGKRQSE